MKLLLFSHFYIKKVFVANFIKINRLVRIFVLKIVCLFEFNYPLTEVFCRLFGRREAKHTYKLGGVIFIREGMFNFVERTTKINF